MQINVVGPKNPLGPLFSSITAIYIDSLALRYGQPFLLNIVRLDLTRPGSREPGIQRKSATTHAPGLTTTYEMREMSSCSGSDKTLWNRSDSHQPSYWTTVSQSPSRHNSPMPGTGEELTSQPHRNPIR
jgi:hypothetical protein